MSELSYISVGLKDGNVLMISINEYNTLKSLGNSDKFVELELAYHAEDLVIRENMITDWVISTPELREDLREYRKRIEEEEPRTFE